MVRQRDGGTGVRSLVGRMGGMGITGKECDADVDVYVWRHESSSRAVHAAQFIDPLSMCII